jgi:hypothetical protein
MPKWNRKSLADHFVKRLRKDSACLEDVMGRPAPSITEADYERESTKVLSTAWICYCAEGQDNQRSGRHVIAYHQLADHFVDDRLLITIVSCKTETILTCYHEHFDRPHKPSHSKNEQMVRYVERLGYQRKGDMLRSFTVKRFKPTADLLETLGAELAKVKAIQEDHPR